MVQDTQDQQRVRGSMLRLLPEKHKQDLQILLSSLAKVVPSWLPIDKVMNDLGHSVDLCRNGVKVSRTHINEASVYRESRSGLRGWPDSCLCQV